MPGLERLQEIIRDGVGQLPHYAERLVNAANANAQSAPAASAASSADAAAQSAAPGDIGGAVLGEAERTKQNLEHIYNNFIVPQVQAFGDQLRAEGSRLKNELGDGTIRTAVENFVAQEMHAGQEQAQDIVRDTLESVVPERAQQAAQQVPRYFDALRNFNNGYAGIMAGMQLLNGQQVAVPASAQQNQAPAARSVQDGVQPSNAQAQNQQAVQAEVFSFQSFSQQLVEDILTFVRDVMNILTNLSKDVLTIFSKNATQLVLEAGTRGIAEWLGYPQLARSIATSARGTQANAGNQAANANAPQSSASSAANAPQASANAAADVNAQLEEPASPSSASERAQKRPAFRANIPAYQPVQPEEAKNKARELAAEALGRRKAQSSEEAELPQKPRARSLSF